MAPLTGKERRFLRSLAHGETVSLVVGRAGVTPAVLTAIEELFNRRELVKIRVNVEGAASRKALAEEVSERIRAELVGVVGKTVSLYRPAPEDRKGERITLPRS